MLACPSAQVALRGEPEDPAAVPVAEPASGTNGKSKDGQAARELPPLLPLDRVPQLPQVGGRRAERRFL